MESYYGCCGSATTPGAGAGIDGNSYLFAIGNDQAWKTYTETFTYTGCSNVLTFYAQASGTDTDAAFTNIVLTADAAKVHTPSAFGSEQAPPPDPRSSETAMPTTLWQ